MDKKRLIFFLFLALSLAGSLIWGIILGHPGDMRMEASGL